MRLRWRRIALATAAVPPAFALLALAVLAASAAFTRLPGEYETPAGIARNQALYVTMRDGTRIAADVWLPDDYAGDRLPAMLYMTRYWRAQAVGPAQRAAIGLGLVEPEDQPFFPARKFNAAGYAFVQVDARGSGASFGWRIAEFAPAEIADYGEIIDWISAQPWSSGRVGTIGVSYNGNTAELASVTRRPALKAVAPLYSDFDPMLGLVLPGGARTIYLDRWGWGTGRLDRNDVCALANASDFLCPVLKLWAPGVKPVGADRDGTLLEAALAEHEKNADVAAAFRDVNFRDDEIGASGLRTADIAPYGLRDRIEESGVAMFLWLGWLDAATVDGALSRYNTFSNPQRIVIGPFSHGGRHDTDPFHAANAPVALSLDAQYEEKIAFFDGVLKEPPGAAPSRGIRYYTLGADRWRETDVWPPAGLEDAVFYFAPDGALLRDPPDSGADTYAVDFAATSGERTRWHTNIGGGDVVYPDRAAQDRKLLTYTTAPFASDVEITGSPVVTLHLESTAPDTVVHAYLEDVAPDGRVTYVTEGVFRVLHRKIAKGSSRYALLEGGHSFARADAMPLPPGETAEIGFNLYATSVRIGLGHRLRIALAGADRSMFAPVSKGEPPRWTVSFGGAKASRLSVPMRLWTVSAGVGP